MCSTRLRRDCWVLCTSLAAAGLHLSRALRRHQTRPGQWSQMICSSATRSAAHLPQHPRHPTGSDGRPLAWLSHRPCNLCLAGKSVVEHSPAAAYACGFNMPACLCTARSHSCQCQQVEDCSLPSLMSRYLAALRAPSLAVQLRLTGSIC